MSLSRLVSVSPGFFPEALFGQFGLTYCLAASAWRLQRTRGTATISGGLGVSNSSAAVTSLATEAAPVKTLGVDLSANPKKTGACVIDWSEQSVRLLERPVDDDVIVDVVDDCAMTGFDVPFGWPDDFVAAVLAHHAGKGWPPIEVPSPEDRVPLRFRCTDRVLHDQGMRPLSVSTDRIGVATMRGARILELLDRRGLPIDRSGTSGVVAEVYPAAALRSWGLPSTGYKGSKNRNECLQLMALFADTCGSLSTVVAACLEGGTDDDLDAVICAFVAKALHDGDTTRPDSSQLETARREGWIHVPTRSPAKIAELTHL